MTNARSTQQYTEVALSDVASEDKRARVTQSYVEVAISSVASNDLTARVTDQYVEAGVIATSSSRNAAITDQYVEVATGVSSSLRNAALTQQYIEVATLHQPGVLSPGVYTYNDEIILYGELIELARETSVNCYFQYRELGAETWTDTTPQPLTAVGYFSQYISGLTPNGEYEYRVVVNWNSGDSSFTTDPYTFKLYWVVEKSKRFDHGIVDSVSLLGNSLVTDHFYTDFKNYPTGSFPSEFRIGYYSIEGSWTIVNGDSLSSENRVLRLAVTTTNSYRRALFLNNLDFQNSIVARVKTNSKYTGVANTLHHGVIIRASGDSTTETCYFAGFRAGPSDLFEMAKYVNGTLTTIDSVSFPWIVNRYYFIKLKAIDDLIQAKVWEGNLSDEPSSWTVSGSDPSISSGSVGLFNFYVGVTSKVVDFDLVDTNQYEAIGQRLIPYVLPTRFPASQIRWDSITPSGTSISVKAQSKTTSPIVDEVAVIVTPPIVIEISDTITKTGSTYAGVYAIINTTTKPSRITEVKYKSSLTSEHRFRLQSSDGTIDYADIYSSTKDGDWVVFTLSSPVTLSASTTYRFYFTFTSQTIFWNGNRGYFGEYLSYTQVFIDGLGLRTYIIGLSISCSDPIINQAMLAYWPTDTPSVIVDDIEETEFSLDINDRRLLIFDSPLSSDAVIEATYTAVDEPIENDWEEQTNETAISLFTGWEYTEGKVLWLRQSLETTDETVSSSLNSLEIELSGATALLLLTDIAAQSSTDVIIFDCNRTLSSTIVTQSETSNFDIDLTRNLIETISADSLSSPIFLKVDSSLSSDILAQSATNLITLTAEMILNSICSSVSSSSAITLSVGIEYTTSIIGSSDTYNIVLFTDKIVDDTSLLWPLIHAQSNVSEAHLQVSGDTELNSNIYAQSTTSSPILSVPVYFISSISASSSTDSVLLGTIRPLSSTAIVESVTSNIEVTFEVAVTSNISAFSNTAETGLSISRKVNTSILSNSSTSQAMLTTEISWSSSVAPISQTSIIEIEILRPLTVSITAESFLAQPSLTVFEEDPIDDEIIALARNYRVVIPSVALNGSGDQIRVKFRAHSAQPTVISGSSIGQRLGSTEDYQPTTPVRLKFNNGENSYIIPGGTEYWSDWVDFELDSTIDHFIHVFINANPHYYRTKDQAGPTYIRQGAFDDTMVEDVPSGDYSLDSKHYHVVTIEARDNSNIGIERNLSTDISAISETANSRLGSLLVFDRFITAFSNASSINLGIEYEVFGLIMAQSLTSDISLDYVLYSNISASSATSEITLSLGVDRNLSTEIYSESLTPSIDLILDWNFTSDIIATSITDSSELTVVSALLFSSTIYAQSESSIVELPIDRAFSSSALAASTIDVSLDILRRMSASILTASDAATIGLLSSVPLASNIYASSVTSDTVSLKAIIALLSEISSETYSTADLIVQRNISVDVAAESEVSIVSLISSKEFISDIFAESVCSVSELNNLRSLYSEILSYSNVPSISIVTLSEIESSIVASSQTGAINIACNRPIDSNILSESNTSTVDCILYRTLSSDIIGVSDVSTTDLIIISEFRLFSNISAQSTLSDIHLLVSSIRDLGSQSIAFSSTTLVVLNVNRPLSSDISSNSFDLQPILSIDRSQNSVISTESVTSDAYLSLIRSLFSSLFAISLTDSFELHTCSPFYSDIIAESSTDESTIMADLFPIIIDTRIFQETPERIIDSATPIRIYVSSTPVRVIQSQTPLLGIEHRTGTEVYSIPYEVKPYPFV